MSNSAASTLRILQYLAENGESGVSEIARHLNMPKGTVYRLLRPLIDTEFVGQNPETRTYFPTVKILRLAHSVRSRTGSMQLAHAALLELARLTGETVNLGVFRKGDIIYVDKINSTELFTIEIRIGSRVPAYSVSLGKAILAYLPESDLIQYMQAISFTPHTSKTIAGERQLRKQLHEIKTVGYALDEGELLSDVYCAAVPILDSMMRPLAAISVSAPRSRFKQKRQQLIPAIKKVATELSMTLGEIGENDLPS